MVRQQPTIKQLWPEIKTFLGEEVIIAHNGFNFDFIILDRLARQIDGQKLTNRRIDTLAMARNLYSDLSNSVDSLMERLGIKSSERHRAMGDVHILAEIFQKLQQEKLAISKKLALESFLDYVALGNFIEHTVECNEDRIFFINGARKLITQYSQILKKYCTQFVLDEQHLFSAIRNRLSELNPFTGNFNSQEQLMVKIKAMTSQYDPLPIDEAVTQFLSMLSLNSAQDELEDINAVSLLTYHAAKGLEFEKVIIMGLENNNMPGFHAIREDSDDDRPLIKKMEEQRRLLYVGITRAKNELILTVVKNRGGWQQEYSPFIKELEIPYTTG
jgi:superfamily I DNA/RNA helicase